MNRKLLILIGLLVSSPAMAEWIGALGLQSVIIQEESDFAYEFAVGYRWNQHQISLQTFNQAGRVPLDTSKTPFTEQLNAKRGDYYGGSLRYDYFPETRWVAKDVVYFALGVGEVDVKSEVRLAGSTDTEKSHKVTDQFYFIEPGVATNHRLWKQLSLQVEFGVRVAIHVGHRIDEDLNTGNLTEPKFHIKLIHSL